MTTLTKQQAHVLECLLGNAGYLDDPDEIINDMLEGTTERQTRDFCVTLNMFVEMVNEHKTEKEKLTLDCVQELDQIIGS